MVEEIATGGFGVALKVREVNERHGRLLAAKVLRSDFAESLVIETIAITLLRSERHKAANIFVPTLRAAGSTADWRFLVLLMELADAVGLWRVSQVRRPPDLHGLWPARWLR